jgi:hypothetical protein
LGVRGRIRGGSVKHEQNKNIYRGWSQGFSAPSARGSRRRHAAVAPSLGDNGGIELCVVATVTVVKILGPEMGDDGENQDETPGWASSGYVISAQVWGTTPHPISRAEYESLAHSADDLRAILEMEESYDVLIRNYMSLEKALAVTLVDIMVLRERSRVEFDRRRREADRQLVNLLASGEMYADHLLKMIKRRQRAAKAGGRPFQTSTLGAVQAVAGEQRARFLGVRALKAMRDHVLHLSLPVKGWNQNTVWVPHDGKEVMRFTYSVGMGPAAMTDLANTDPALVAELEARADKKGRVPWLPLVREYVEGASYVHKAARDALASLEADAVGAIAGAIEAYRAATSIPEETKGAMAVAKVGPRWNLADERSIDFDYQEQVDDLRATNHVPLTNLHRRQFLA